MEIPCRMVGHVSVDSTYNQPVPKVATNRSSRISRSATTSWRFSASAQSFSSAYAVEELVAELGAAFLCVSLGVTLEAREDHAAYISHWLKILKTGQARDLHRGGSCAKGGGLRPQLAGEPSGSLIWPPPYRRGVLLQRRAGFHSLPTARSCIPDQLHHATRVSQRLQPETQRLHLVEYP